MTVQKRIDFASIIADLQSRVGVLERSNRLNHASITEGGLSIRNGGNLWLRDGGDLYVQDGGSLFVEGGDLVIMHGGTFKSLYANDEPAAWFGPLTPDDVYDQGFVLFAPSGPAQMWITRMADGTFAATFGNGVDSILPEIDFFEVNSKSIWMKSSNFFVLSNGDNAISIAGLDTVSIGRTSDPNKGIITQGTNTWIQGHTTTAGSANCIITSNGAILRITSSRRYKQDIETAVIDTGAVLALEPRTFRRKVEVEQGTAAMPVPPAPVLDEDGRPTGEVQTPEAPVVPPKTYVGFIAEEAEELGLTDWVEYDEDGQVEGFGYSSFVVAHQAVLREHQQLIEAQQAQIETLQQQVATLTARLDSMSS